MAFGAFPRAVAFVAALMVVAATARAQAPVAEEAPLTREQCLREALARSPLIAAAEQNVAVFEAKLNEAWWSWFPNLSFEATIGPTPAKRGDALSGSTDYDEWGPWWRIRLEGGMPIFTFGKIRALKRAAAEGVDVALATLDLARDEVRYRVMQAWAAWQFGRQMEADVAEGRGYLDRARVRLERLDEEDSEDFDQIDLLRLRVYQADIQTLEVEARRLQVLALHGLALLMGRQGEGGVVAGAPPLRLAVEDIEPVEVALGELPARLAESAGHQPSVRAGRHGVAAYEALADAKQAELYPDFFIGGYLRYSQSPVADEQGSPFAYDPWNTWSGGAAVGLRYSFDIPAKLARARGARAEASRTAELARVEEARVALEVEQTWREASDLQDLLGTYRQAQRAARSWVMAKSDLHDAGFGALEDVTEALVEFYKRKLGYLKAVHDYNDAVARLSKAVGSDLLARGTSAQPEGEGP